MPAHEDVLTKQEVVELTGWTPRHVERKEKSGELRSRETGHRGNNGKPIKQYFASSLPARFQMKRLQQRLQSQALVPIKQSPTAIATLPAPGSDLTIRAMSSLNDEERRQVETRLQVIGPMIDFQNRTNGSKPVFKTDGGAEITSLSGVVRHLAAISGFSERSIWTWWQRYIDPNGGPAALADRRRSDLNTSRYFSAHRDAGQFAQNKYLNEKLSIRLVHEALLRDWPRLRNHENDAPPSYESLRVYLHGLSPLIVAVAREGERRYKEDFAPFLIRDISAKRPNEYWISDHMIHDVFVYNDGVFGELENGEAFRPVLTCIQDMRSRRILGTAWCVNPSSESISSALRVALRQFGLPQTLYIDNGLDYKKVAGKAWKRPGLSLDCTGVLDRLGIRSQHCLPYHPQSKEIESFFRTYHQRFDVLYRRVGAYSGRSPAARPEACDAAREHHKKLLKQREALRNNGASERDLASALDASPLPRASEFIRCAIQWIEDFNQVFPHSGQGMRKRSPCDVYDAELPPEQRKPVDIVQVAHLFWSRVKRDVKEGGKVRLFNTFYEPADAATYGELQPIVTQQIQVACDPMNVGEAIALTLDDRPLGVLRAQALLVHGATSAAEIRQSLRLRNRAHTAAKQYLAAQERARLRAGDVPELELLSRRAMANVTAEENIHHAFPVLKAVNAPEPRKSLHAGNIADEFEEE
jgi:transposase InsO family protein